MLTASEQPGLPSNIEKIPEDELKDFLYRFYAEIRKQTGGEYEPDSIAVMHGSLDRHLKNNGKSYSILRDRKFAMFIDLFLDATYLKGNRTTCLSNLALLGIFLIQDTYDRHLVRLHRRHRGRAYAPTSNTASHDNHEKINSWVSFFSLNGNEAPLGVLSGHRSSAKINGYWIFCTHLCFSRSPMSSRKNLEAKLSGNSK